MYNIVHLCIIAHLIGLYLYLYSVCFGSVEYYVVYI